MAARIVHVFGDEILDSRGHPTLRVSIVLRSGQVVSASVPSGASTGEGEARELRDGNSERYGGRGVLKAINNVAELGGLLQGQDPTRQAEIDQMLIDCDGTDMKTRLGANAIIGISMAVARAGASAIGQPLYAYLSSRSAYPMPVPMMNVINGGRHASNGLDFQEFMIVPHGAPSFREALRWGVETYHALRTLLAERGLATGVGDEGGFAPRLDGNEAPCTLIVEAIGRAGYKPGEQIALALDPAASSFWRDGAYELAGSGGGRMDAKGLQSLYAEWVRKYPIVSIEDGFDEHDWSAFREQCAMLGESVQIVGDDLYVTNRRLIERGIAEQATNAALIKLNQIGTVTETIQAIEACRRAGWNYIVSHRSGETNDAFIADFTVAMGGRQIKAGAPCRGERIAKYNRLLAIERELGEKASYMSPFRASGAFSSMAGHPHADDRRSLLGHKVIAVIEEASTARRCLTLAQQAASIDSTLSLTALHICVDPDKLIAAAEEIDIQKMREFREGTARERLARARTVFEGWLGSTGADVKWLEQVGDVTSSLVAEVGDAALITIARPRNLDSADALHAAIFHSGRPVLHVPADGPIPAKLGQHMLIAWKPTPQARRVIQNSRPWLLAAERVTVVTINRAHDAKGIDEVLGLLADNGIHAEIRHARTHPGEHVAERILAEAQEMGADCVVMGAYHYGAMIEAVFGGVTREVLQYSRLPVFLTH